MTGVRVLRFALLAGISLLLILSAGCAFREEPCCPEEKPEEEKEMVWAKQTEVDSLEERVEHLQEQLTEAKTTTAEAMTTAEKALKCCREDYAPVMTEEIFFGFDSAELTDFAREKLDGLAERLKQDPDYIIEITGHTDAVGSNAYNLRLGQQRADAVRSYFANTHNVDLSRIAISSAGEQEPQATNDTEDGRARNRRATISVMGFDLE